MLDANASKISGYQGLIFVGYSTLWYQKKGVPTGRFGFRITGGLCGLSSEDGSLTADCVINDFKQAVKKL